MLECRLFHRVAGIFLLIIFLPFGVLGAKPQPLASPRAVFKFQDNLSIEELDTGIYRVIHAWPWPSNSLVVLMSDSTLLLVDTPYTPEGTQRLLLWAKTQFKVSGIKAIVTHYHIDRMGGVPALLEEGIPVYGSNETAQLIEEKGNDSVRKMADWVKEPAIRETYRHLWMEPPSILFPQEKGLLLGFGKETVEVYYPGPGHTPDNLVVWFSDRKLLFGGCLINRSDKMGNLTEADLDSWEKSIQTLMKRYKPQWVIPGHGGESFHFSSQLLPHTLKVVRDTIKLQPEKSNPSQGQKGPESESRQ